MKNHSPNRKNVSIYIDHPNINLSNYDNEIFLKAIREKYGDVLKCNSYWAFGTTEEDKGNPKRVQQSSYFLNKNNINFIPVSSVGGGTMKNPTDSKIIVDIIEDLFLNDHFDTFVLVTADRDFIPVLKKIIEKGKEVVVVLPQTSPNLREFSHNMGATVLKLKTLMRKYAD